MRFFVCVLCSAWCVGICMRYGYCANLNFMLTDDPRGRKIFEGVLAAGYDYLETQLTSLLNFSPPQYAEIKSRLSDTGVPCRVNMLLFPGDMPLVGNDRNLGAMLEHVKRVLPIAADLGSELIVFGHGGTRCLTDGLSHETVRRQIIDALQMINPLAASYNLKIAIEPFCSKETDMITSFDEAVSIARECGHATGALLDLYHCITEGQSPNDITKAPDKLFHLHIAYPPTRTIPSENDDGADYIAFADAVKSIGYNNTLSIEAAVPENADISATIAGGLKKLRELFG